MTPDEQAQAGRAEASALEPDHVGHGEPLQTGAFTFEEYEARARAERDWWVQYGGTSAEQAQAEYEADLYAASSPDPYQEWMEAQEPEAEAE